MPELPDLTVYVEALAARIEGQPIERVRLGSPFVLRTVTPALAAFEQRRVIDVARHGKRIVIACTGEHFLAMHLMIAGRLHWRRRGAAIGARGSLLAIDFASGTLVLTEAGSRRRAALYALSGRTAVSALHAGGVEVLECTPAQFAAALVRENHTLKRALTDPRIVSGIGNAYSDEILFHARQSPFRQTAHLTAAELQALHRSAVAVLTDWTARLRAAARAEFPRDVTAFRPQMAVHGRYRQPCRACAAPIQRIVYAERESNYCARCQAAGQVYADRALSRLLKANWPRTIEELEQPRTQGADEHDP
jgi:formamidopyrimidine-DNA glycosylase